MIEKEQNLSDRHEPRRPRKRRPSKVLDGQDDDPLAVIVNMFDVAMVFAVSLMVALVLHMNMAEFFGKEDFTIVKNPGTKDMEIITKEGKEIKKYTPKKQNESSSVGKGRRIGIAYELENGEIIYVPEE